MHFFPVSLSVIEIKDSLCTSELNKITYVWILLVSVVALVAGVIPYDVGGNFQTILCLTLKAYFSLCGD